MIKNQTYPIKNLLLTKEVVSSFIQFFWNDVFTKLDINNKYLMILVKVKFSDEIQGYKTLGHLRSLNFNNKELFINYIVQRLGVLVDSYTVLPISEITFSYIIKEGQATERSLELLNNTSDKELTIHRFNNMNLPITMDPYLYGKVLNKGTSPLEGYIRYTVSDIKNRLYLIDQSIDLLINKVTLLGGSELNWIDTIISDILGNDGFKREIQKSTIYFVDGEIVLRKQLLSGAPFKKMKTEKAINNRFITFDIETIKQGNNLIPYLICAYNGVDHIVSYSNSSLNQKVLFTNFIYSLLTFFGNKGRRLIVYGHILAGFDGVYLLRQLVSFGKVKPKIFGGKIKSIELTLNIVGHVGKTIVFRDSYQLLPYSLRQLCKAFNITLGKGWFPFNLSDIWYKGVLPAFNYWNISIEEYETLVKKYTGITWNFKDEAIKYCKLDCKCLHEILVLFNELIFNKFRINIHSSLTAPSLAMRIYKTHFKPEDTIFSLHGKVEQDIRQSYTGGVVDVYIPHNKIGSFFSKTFRKLFYYDVNSLYPTVMAKGDMPIGTYCFRRRY